MKTTLIDWTLIGSGGFLGAVARYGLSGLVHRQLPATGFPVGTLTVNLVGCLAIGALAGLVEARQLFGPEVRRFAMIGLLGGFTTYSTFGFETFALLKSADYLRAFAYAGAHLLAGLVCVGLGYGLASR